MKKILVLFTIVLITYSCSSEKEYKTPEELIKANAAYMNEEDFNDETLFSIWDSDKRSYLYGAIKFNDSKKLSSIDKNWGTSVNDSHSQIFEQIIQLLDIYKNTGEIKVETQEIFEPNYKARKLSFIQGKKVIELSLNGNRIILKELLKESE